MPIVPNVLVSSINTEEPQRGRPSAGATERRRAILKPYFNRGVSAVVAHEATVPIFKQQGLPYLALSGVQVMFAKWGREMAEQYSKNELERETEIRARACRAIDSQIMILQNGQADLENAITIKKQELVMERGGEIQLSISQTLSAERRAYCNAIISGIKLKMEIETTPTLTDELKGLVSTYVAEGA